MEEAEAYQRLMDEFNMTQQQVAVRVSKSRPAVANFLRLCQLPQPIKDSLTENLLSMGHARALLGVESLALQTEAWKIIMSKGLSVRQTEALVKKLKSEPKQKVTKPNEPYFNTLAEDLSRRFGTKVNIKRNGDRGKVVIEFYSNDDLDRLLEFFQE
jgi:ParB family chromosome partitioning protein